MIKHTRETLSTALVGRGVILDQALRIAELVIVKGAFLFERITGQVPNSAHVHCDYDLDEAKAILTRKAQEIRTQKTSTSLLHPEPPYGAVMAERAWIQAVLSGNVKALEVLVAWAVGNLEPVYSEFVQ